MATFSSGTNLHSNQLNLSCMGLCHSTQHTSNMQSTNYSFKHLHEQEKNVLFFPSGIRSCSAGARVHFLWACCSVTIYRRCLWPFVGATFVGSSLNEDFIFEQKMEHPLSASIRRALDYVAQFVFSPFHFTETEDAHFGFFPCSSLISRHTRRAEGKKIGGRNFSPFKCDDDDGFIIVNVIQYVGLSHHHLSTTATIVCVSVLYASRWASWPARAVCAQCAACRFVLSGNLHNFTIAKLNAKPFKLILIVLHFFSSLLLLSLWMVSGPLWQNGCSQPTREQWAILCSTSEQRNG